MNIDRLRYFTAVVETKNLRMAAAMVGISPGSMSKAISVLESELNAKLLRPEGRGIAITEAGLQIYRRSTVLLDEYRRFRRDIRLASTQVAQPKLRIATFEIFSSYFLSSFIAQDMPEHEVLLLELAPGYIEKAILDRQVDYGLTYLPAPHSQLQFLEIGQLQMGIWGHAAWRKVAFAEWPFAVPITSVQINAQEYDSLDQWPHDVAFRKVKYEFELLETALQTSSFGKSVLHCPDIVAVLYNRRILPEHALVRLDYPVAIRRTKALKIFLVTHKGGDATALERKLAKFIRLLNRASTERRNARD